MRAAFVLLVCATAYGNETPPSSTAPTPAPTTMMAPVAATACMVRKFPAKESYRQEFDDPCVNLPAIEEGNVIKDDLVSCLRNTSGDLYTTSELGQLGNDMGSTWQTTCNTIVDATFLNGPLQTMGVCNAGVGVAGVCTTFQRSQAATKPTAPPVVGAATKVSKGYTIGRAITTAQIAAFNDAPPIEAFLRHFFAHTALKDVDPAKVSMTMTKTGEVVAVSVEIEGRAIAASDFPATFAYSDADGNSVSALSDELAAPSASTEDDDDSEMDWAIAMIIIAGVALVGGSAYLVFHKSG